MGKFSGLKKICYESNMELVKRNLVIYTFGNVSVIDRELGVIAIKPSGVPYKKLRSRDMVIVDLENKVVCGKLNPSSDTKTHLVLYKNFSNIGSVVHTHSTYATAWAQSSMPIPVFGTTHADHLAADIPCTKIMDDKAIKGDYETETGKQILDLFKNLSYEEIEMVLIAGHGPFSWGKTPDKAVYNSVIMEEVAKMAILTLQINPKTKRLKAALIEKHYQRKHGNGAYYGQS